MSWPRHRRNPANIPANIPVQQFGDGLTFILIDDRQHSIVVDGNGLLRSLCSTHGRTRRCVIAAATRSGVSTGRPCAAPSTTTSSTSPPAAR
jgi:hypothetical protein